MKKTLSMLLTLAMLFSTTSALIFPAAAATITIEQIEETAIEIPLTGKSIAMDLENDISPYKTGASNIRYVYCILEIPKDGTLDMTVSANRPSTQFQLWTVNSKGKIKLYPFDTKSTVGTAVKGPPQATARWNEITQEAKSIFSYKLSKGTYYLEFPESTNSKINNKITVSAKMRDDKTNVSSNSKSSENSAISTYVNIKKGSSIQLTSNQNKVTWKSSKTSVATVSSSGKVTAKAKGTAIITATANGKSSSIKVNVTE